MKDYQAQGGFPSPPLIGEDSGLSGPEYYPPMGHVVDAGKRSTILRREGLPFPASAARTVEGPLAVGGDKNQGVGVGRTPFPDPPRGSRPLAGFHGRQDLARAKWNPGGKRSGRRAVLAARRYSPPRRIAPPRQDCWLWPPPGDSMFFGFNDFEVLQYRSVSEIYGCTRM